jgi:hypothetical protein
MSVKARSIASVSLTSATTACPEVPGSSATREAAAAKLVFQQKVQSKRIHLVVELYTCTQPASPTSRRRSFASWTVPSKGTMRPPFVVT